MRSPTAASIELTIPSPAALVHRKRPMALLAEPTWHVASVAAPAGFGKTSLLAEWASTQPGATAWLSCDAADRGPGRFWSAVVASLSARWPGVGDDLLATLERDGFDPHDGPASLANDLADVDEPITIVIDDLHLAGPSADVLAALIGALPQNARLALGSRIVPAVTLGRLRVAGSLLEVRTDDLRFSSDETVQLLRNHELELEPSDVTRLQELTEGWPAAVQLAAMSMKRRPDRHRFLDSLATTDLALADFLVSEVLDELPVAWLEFLSATCVLDEFDVELCVRLTGRDDAGAVLQDLVAAGLFVTPLDGAGGWFRYHHLFGAFMRARVKSLGSRRFAELNRQASAALEERGLVVEAMRLSIAQGDADGAALIARRAFWHELHPVDVDVTCEATRLWLHEYGDAAVTADPIRLLTLITPVVFAPPSEETASWLARVDAAHPDPRPELTAHLHTNWCEYHLARGEVDEALFHRDRAMAPFGGRPPADPELALMHVMAVRADLEAGDLDGARCAAELALSAPTGHRVLDVIRLPALRAWIAYVEGDLVLAERLAASVLERLGETGISESEVGHIWAWLVIAGLHAERLEDDAGAAALAHARRLADRSARPWLQCEVALQQAAFARTVGDPEAAGLYLDLARALLANPAPIVLARFDLEAARQCARFVPADAGPLLDALGDDTASRLARASFAVARDDHPTARQLLEPPPTSMTVRQRVEWEVLQALAAPAREECRRHLELALRTAGAQRFVRTVIAAAPGVSPRLDSVARDDAGYVASLLRAAAASSAPPAGMVTTALSEPLSTSELSVLRYLSSRLTNREIAAALYVSINTLKTHIKSIYRKLGVSSRGQAVVAGQRHHLI